MKIKIIFAILLCLALIMCLVSCSNDDTDDTSSSPDVQESTDSEESTSDTEDKPDTEVFFTVTFVTGCDASIEPISVKKDDKIAVPQEITRNGYTLVGWYVNDEEWSFDNNTVTGDITLSAKWTPNANTLIFNANGGEGTMPNMPIVSDTTVSLTLIGFTRAGYSFAGWATTEGGEVEYEDGASYTVGTESTYTLFAVWVASENTLTFDANGGEGTMSDMTISTDDTVNLTQSAFTKEGYKLVGWSTTAGGNVEYEDGASYTMGASSTNTLFAVWEALEYTVIFEKNGGEGISEGLLKFTIEDLPVKLSDLTKQNHIFCGWHRESDFSDNPISEITEIGMITLYAEFVEGSSGLAFKENDGAYIISGYTGTEADVIIPITFKGKPVTAIGSFAFSNCTTLKGITIPNSITSIGDNAFRDCTALTRVEISDSVVSIGSYAFRGCSAITGITIPSSITGISEGMFYSCSGLESIKIPSGIAIIDDDAFRGCKKLADVEIPDSVTYIGVYSFRDCTSLASVTLPSSVSSIGDYAFFNCFGLASITVDTENPIYKSIDGSLYTKDEKTLVQYALGKKDTAFAIPSTVTAVGGSAFEGCTALTSVVIPSGISSIGDYAFSGCTNLASINIPRSVTKIGWYSFQNCTSLLNVIVPKDVAKIGYNAFKGCTNLLIYCEAESNLSDWADNWSFGCTVEMGILSYGQTEGGLIWVENKNEKVIIVECDKNVFSVSIPSSINGSEVTSIDRYVFKNCTNLTSIVIPSTVSTIGLSQFEGCTGLTIYCEAASQPSGWDSTWNKSKCPIVWDCNNTDVSSDGYIYVVIDKIRYKLKGTTAELARQSSGIEVAYIPEKITYNELEYNVTKINASAFYNCTKLTTVSIPSSVISIGNTVFYNCISLTDISVDEGNKNHKSVDGSLYSKNGKTLMQYALGRADTEFAIPNTVTTINGFAFYGNSSLTSITFSSAMTSIGSNAFYGCKGLISVTIPSGITKIGDSAFRECTSLVSVTMSDDVTSIENNAFRGCSRLTDASISNNATKIGDSAFRDCISLADIIIPNSVTTINGSAFYGCTALANVVMSNSVTTIGGSAFRYCTSLKSIIIPSSVTKISDSAFRDCSKLTIYCEVDSKPGDWHGNWNYSKCEVVWGYKEEQAN